MDTVDFWKVIQSTGPWGLIAFLTTMLFAGKVRLEREFVTMREDRDEWKARAEKSLSLADRGATVAAATVGLAPDNDRLRRMEDDFAALRRYVERA